LTQALKNLVEKEIIQWRRRLQLLKEKEALLGISADPSIKIEIEDIEAKLEELRVELSRLDQIKGIHNKLKLVEFLFILDWAVWELGDLRYATYTFGESRRKLALARKLWQKVLAYFHRISEDLDETLVNDLWSYINETLNSYIYESNNVIKIEVRVSKNELSSETYRASEHRRAFEKSQYRAIQDWSNLQDRLFKDMHLKANFEELGVNELYKWPLIGFENAKEYQEYISPSFDTLCKNASALELELLSFLTQIDEVTENTLLDQGFPNEIIVETLNTLMRGKLMSRDDNKIFRLSNVGRKIILVKLQNLA
jgi:hypothetical protein